LTIQLDLKQYKFLTTLYPIMKFCVQCSNMYYIGIDAEDTNQLTYYCRHCGHVDEYLTKDGLCVLETHFKQNTQNTKTIINPYTKLDPTLPRIRMHCPNEACKINTADDEDKLAEVIYIRYNDADLKYIYMCTTCDTTWKTDERK